jgi:hypothetical protein
MAAHPNSDPKSRLSQLRERRTRTGGSTGSSAAADARPGFGFQSGSVVSSPASFVTVASVSTSRSEALKSSS